MTAMVEIANRSIQEPEVQEMLKRLSAYGLGVFMPHMHTATEDFAPLPSDMVQVEQNLKVSFQPRSEASGVAVGWVWDDQVKAAAICLTCKVRQHDHSVRSPD